MAEDDDGDMDTFIIEEHVEFVDADEMMVPIEVEEVDRMNVDMGEFIEAKTIRIHKIPENSEVFELESFTNNPNNEDDEDENLITQKFLNGEVSFSEYTMGIDQDSDEEEGEAEFKNVVNATNSKNVENELQLKNDKPIKPRRREKGWKRPRRNLPPALAGLMGQANIAFAKGDAEIAEKICLEIIRQHPTAPEPFQTLAMIYEKDNPQKAQQFSLIASHLAPKDAAQWIDSANAALESRNIKEAIQCYTKAIQSSPKSIEIYEIRAKLQFQNGDKRAYIKAYSKLLGHLGTDDSENVFKYGKLLTQYCVQENDYETALGGMDCIFKKCPELVTMVEVNQILDVLIALKKFETSIDILSKFTSIKIERDDEKTIISCEIPNDIPVDIRAKCIVCLVELESHEVVESIIIRFHASENPEVSGDLFLDIAEALMEKKKFETALNFLEPLVKSQNYSAAAVIWLRHAECLAGCKNYLEAIKSYENVNELSPNHLGAKLELAKLYEQVNELGSAINALNQDDFEDLNQEILYEKIKLLLKTRRYDEYFHDTNMLLSRHCETLKSKLDLNALSRASSVRHRVEILQRDRLARGEPILEENLPKFTNENEIEAKQEYLLFLQMCRVAFKLKRFGLLQRICFRGLTSKKFEAQGNHLLFLCLIACIHNNDSYSGFNIVRDMVRTQKKPILWNLLNIVIQRAEDSRHNRFMMRLLQKEDVFSDLHILHANNCLVSGTYKYALNDYISLFKVKPNALLALLISVTLLQMACQKFSAKKNQLVVQAIAFLKTYMELRGDDGSQEANYNMARLLHQLGLLPAAVNFYKLVLESPVPKLIADNSNLLNLKKEAAFNLHLIYVGSENYDLARFYLENYITV